MTIRLIKPFRMKEAFLQALLHLNEYFDDDILLDAINLLLLDLICFLFFFEFFGLFKISAFCGDTLCNCEIVFEFIVDENGVLYVKNEFNQLMKNLFVERLILHDSLKLSQCNCFNCILIKLLFFEN